MRVVFKPAEDSDRYFIMDVRNAGRMNMTHDTRHITKEMQDAWWFSADSAYRHIWVAYLEDEDEFMPVGFCMLREMYDSGRVYGTLAVHPEWHGMGIGTAIYMYMTRQCNEVWLDILNTNAASMHAATKAGFKYYSSNDIMSTYVYRK